MLNNSFPIRTAYDDQPAPPQHGFRFILGMVSVAALSTLASELMRWGVDELRSLCNRSKPSNNNDSNSNNTDID